jgi:hypothetical protein
MPEILKGGEHLTEKQHRRLRKLSVKVEKITEGDRRFFERFPHRQHRIRIAGAAEIEQLELIAGEEIWRTKPSDSDCFYAAVKNVRRGGRIRFMFACPEGLDCDAPEEIAKIFYENHATDEIREKERFLLESR